MSTKIETTTGELSYYKLYYLKNKERVKLKSKENYFKNKEKRKLKRQSRYSENKDLYKQKCRERYYKNKEKFRLKYQENKELYLTRNRQSNEKHKEKRVALYRNYYKNNRKEILQKGKKYYIKNCETCKQKNRKYHREHRKEFNIRYKTDIQYRLANTLRTHLLILINKQKATKKDSALKLVGCSLTELKTYLESLWQPGMSWNNHTSDGWHIDHIKPVNTFDLTDLEQQRKCFHYTNLRPLWAKENLSRPKDGSDLL